MSHQYLAPRTPVSGLRLHLNENTSGCSTAVMNVLRSITCEQLASYPDYSPALAACSERFGVPADHIVLTNGLDEGVLAASIAALRPAPAAAEARDGAVSFPGSVRPPEAIVIVPAFEMYSMCAGAAGARIVEVPLREGFAFPLEDVLAAVTPATRIIYITNPHNPTGQVWDRQAMLTIAEAAPHATVLLDEAYADFSGTSLLGDARLAALPNLVMGRTFAKAQGLAGLRAGALIGSPRTLTGIRAVVPPYSVNAVTALALPAALRDTPHVDWYREQVEESKRLFYAALDRLGIGYWPSRTNFVLVRFGERASRIVEALAARGINVRDRSSLPGCAGCVRITTGVVEHTHACIAAIEEVV